MVRTPPSEEIIGKAVKPYIPPSWVQKEAPGLPPPGMPPPGIPKIEEPKRPVPKETWFTGPEFQKVFGISLPTGWDASYIWDEAYTTPALTVYTPEGKKLGQEDLGISRTGELVDRTEGAAEASLQEQLMQDPGYWERIREWEALQGIFGKVFPQEDIEELLEGMSVSEEAMDAFIQSLRDIGKTEDTEELLTRMFPEITPEQLNELLGPRMILEKLPEATAVDLWLTTYGLKPIKETLGYKAVQSFLTGIGDVLIAGGGVSRALGYDEVGEGLSSAGLSLQKNIPPYTLGEFDFWDLLNPEFYAVKITRAIPFALSLAPLAIGGFYAGSAVATAAGLGTVASWIIGGFAGAALSRPAESAFEAGGAYDDAIARGKTEIEAKEEFDKIFWDNMWLAGADAWEIGIALAPTPKWVPLRLVKSRLVRTVTVGGKMVIVGLSEGGEEIYQDFILRRARGEEWQWDPISKEVFAIGMVMGLGMGFGGDVISSIVNTSKETMPPAMKNDFERITAELVEQGFTAEQAELRALDIIARTPEGESIVAKAIEGVKKIIAEERGAIGRPEEPGVIQKEINRIEGELDRVQELRKLTAEDKTLTEELRKSRNEFYDASEKRFKEDLSYWQSELAKPPVVPEVKLPKIISDPSEGTVVGAEPVADFLPEIIPQTKLPSGTILRVTIKEEGKRQHSFWAKVDTRGSTLNLYFPLDKEGGEISKEIPEGFEVTREVISHSLIVKEQLAEMNKVLGELQIVKAKPPVVEKPPIEEAPERIVYREGGVPVSPDEPIPQGVVENIPIIQDIGVKERWVRPTRKVFEKMDLYVPYKGIQKAEVLLGEANLDFGKKLKAVAKTVDKSRRHLIFRELENPGSQVGLTFDEKRAVNFFRINFNKWADVLNLPQEKRVKNYITHIFEADITEQLKEEPRLDPAIARALEDRAPKTIFNPFLQERLGKKLGLIEDPFAAALAYQSRQLRVLYYQPLIQKIATIANDPDFPQVARDYLVDYSRRMTKEPSKLDKSINNTLQEFAGAIEKLPGGKPFASFLTRGNPSGLAAYQFTGVIYTLWLGFKPTSAIRNLSQHTLILGEVGPIHFANAFRLRLTEEGKAALAESLVLRSRKAAFIPGIDDSFVDKWTDKFREAALWMFRYADKQNVSDAFLAGYSEAKSLIPDADRQVWIDRGDEVAADTQYLYTQMNSMAISQSSMGRVFSILTTWSQNWVELMAKWITRRPSSVYKQYEKETGKKVVGGNWSTSYKAILMYMVIIGLGYALKEEERLKAWEYTGITSIRYLADVVGGDFPGLQGPGAIANMIAGFITDDERMFKQGWYDFKSTFTPGIVRQIQNVASGKRDWLTLFFYLEGRDFKLKKLKTKWQKGWKDYEALVAKDRDAYRKDNPLIEAQMFITSKFSTLSTDEARTEVLRLIAEHKIDVEFIDGYEKIFGVDSNKELGELERQLGQVELTEEGERKLKANGELDYYTTSNFASDVNKLVATVGRTKVELDGNALAVEYLRAKDLFVQYESLTTNEARTLFRQQYPDVEALLYLWGEVSTFKNPKSADILLELMDKYNILPEAVPAFLENPERYDSLLTPVYDLKKKTFDLDTEYDNYGNSESTLYIEDAELREEARDKLKADNPEWVDNVRRLEAYGKNVPEGLIDKYAEYYKMPIAGYDQERFLMENEDYYNEVWLGILDNKPKDFDRIPSVEVEALYEQWQRMDLGKRRRDFEAKYPELDRWLALTKGTMLETERGKPKPEELPEAERTRMPFIKGEKIETIYTDPMTHEEFLVEVKRLEEEEGYLPLPGGVSYGTHDVTVYSMEESTIVYHKVEIYDFIKGPDNFYIGRYMDTGKVVMWRREMERRFEHLPAPWPWEEYEERGIIPYLPEVYEGKEV